MKFFKEIPNSRPSTPLLDEINSPKDLKPLTLEQLKNLANELRAFLLYQTHTSLRYCCVHRYKYRY